MSNQLIDLNNHMFTQLDRLNSDDLAGDKLHQEIERSKAMALIGRQVIDNGRLALDAHELDREYGGKGRPPKMLENSTSE